MIFRAFQSGIEWFSLHGDGYQFWSGIGSGSPIIAGFFLVLRHRNCHVHRCWRLAWHTHPGHGHPVCKHHHPHGDSEHPLLQASAHK